MPANSLGTIGPILGQLSAVGTPQRWHSMEDSWKPRVQTPVTRASPNFDVWATQEVGIPLSELGRTGRGRRAPDPLSSLVLRADLDLSPDDSRLGSDLRKLFRENSVGKYLRAYNDVIVAFVVVYYYEKFILCADRIDFFSFSAKCA